MNQNLLLKYIKSYKNHFSEISEKEIYKWKAIAHFQKHWDINAPDFHAMLSESIRTTSNLLASGNYLARRMIKKCAAQDPERVRAAFKKAYQLDTPIANRYEEFKATMVDITSNIPDAKNHYQDHRAFVVYLALRYPEKFYLYKYDMFNAAYQLFDFPLKAKKGAVSNIEKFHSLCEWIKPFLLKDDDLIRLHHKRLDKDTYQDSAYTLLTQDFIYACVNYEMLTIEKENSASISTPHQIEELNLADFQSTTLAVNLSGRRGIDYSLRNERNQKIGAAAELFVLQHEQEKWKHSKKKNKIEHTSLEKGDGVGYDITSIDEKGNEIFIEVKATTGSYKTPFYVSKNELHASIQDSKKYRLYRVYNFDTTTQTGDIKIFKGTLESICNEPVSYMINLEEKNGPT